ncbi:hypothetical protein ACEN19_11175 [Corynebacterium auriscanis]|uniref:hypothetical protein n=1 Tax=Corynebacterium auriscanis TaxID=99807 RepID=UPI003CFAA7D2
MATINDLKELSSKPRTIEEWLDRFDEEDKRVVVESIIRGTTANLWPILSQLEDNPFPFRKDTINHARRILSANYGGAL